MHADCTKLVFLIFFITCLFSCNDSAEDTSLNVDAYVALGLPDPAKKWNMEDYTQAYNVLAQLKWEKPLELPLKESEKSGRLFEHMMSLDYLSFLQDTVMSLNEKAERISEFTRVYGYWIDVYTVPIIKENRYHREIIDIKIFNLRLMEAMVKLAHKINDSKDPADAGLKSGYHAIKDNYLSSLQNDLETQSHTSQFLTRDLDRMADTIYVSVLRNKPWMDSRAIEGLNRSLQLVLDSTASDHIRNKYSSLKKSLNDSEKTGLKFPTP